MNSNDTYLGVYLKDHYAGGIGALELLEHLAKTHQNRTLEGFFSQLFAEVNSDHETLHQLMHALGVDDSSVRNAGAWVAEKIGRAKLGSSGTDENCLRDLQALETLFIGVTGKRLLWHALELLKRSHPSMQQFDFADLQNRAIGQLERIEAKRLELAQAIFA